MNDNFDYLMHIYKLRKSEFNKTSRSKLEGAIERDLRKAEDINASPETLERFRALLINLLVLKDTENSFRSSFFQKEEEYCIAELKETFK